MTCIAQLFNEIAETLDIEEISDNELNVPELLQTIGGKFHDIGDTISSWPGSDDLDDRINVLEEQGNQDFECRLDEVENREEWDDDRICELESKIEILEATLEKVSREVDVLYGYRLSDIRKAENALL